MNQENSLYIETANTLAVSMNTDVVCFNSPLTQVCYNTLLSDLDLFSSLRPKVKVYLSVPSGDFHTAYKIIRHLQRTYSSISVVVYGQCHASATLIVLGANEVSFTPQGFISPLMLNHYLPDDEELSASQTSPDKPYSSPIAPNDPTQFLQEKVTKLYNQTFQALISENQHKISEHQSAQIAANMVNTVFSDVHKQLNIKEIMEQNRLTSTLRSYALRVLQLPHLFEDDPIACIDHFTHSYPHHSFVIDSTEASTLFQVQPLSTIEARLAKLLVEQQSQSPWSAIIPSSHSLISGDDKSNACAVEAHAQFSPNADLNKDSNTSLDSALGASAIFDTLHDISTDGMPLASLEPSNTYPYSSLGENTSEENDSNTNSTFSESLASNIAHTNILQPNSEKVEASPMKDGKDQETEQKQKTLQEVARKASSYPPKTTEFSIPSSKKPQPSLSTTLSFSSPFTSGKQRQEHKQRLSFSPIYN